MKTLYKNIKEQCRKRHMTVFDLEEAAGLPYNTITRWGKTSPGIDKVQKVATALGVSIDELMGGRNVKEK